MNFTTSVLMGVIAVRFRESAIIGRVVLVDVTVFLIMSVVAVHFTEAEHDGRCWWTSALALSPPGEDHHRPYQ